MKRFGFYLAALLVTVSCLFVAPEKVEAAGKQVVTIVIYQSESGDTRIDVKFDDETVWLTQAQMSELFQSSRTNIVEHIRRYLSFARYTLWFLWALFYASMGVRIMVLIMCFLVLLLSYRF